MIEILQLFPIVYLWIYVALAVAFLCQGIFSGLRNEHLARVAGIAVHSLFIGAIGMHLLHFGVRWYINGHAPLQSKHEVFTVTGLTMMMFGGVLYLSERMWRVRGSGAMLGGVVFVLLTGFGGVLWTLLGMTEDYKVHNLVPALQSYWHPPHVAAYMLGYGSLGLAAVLAGFYCIGAGAKAIFGKDNPIAQLATPAVERWTYKVAGYGFPFMTAALCMGALWADDSWGEYWFWDAKETWALISWAFFLIYFHTRYIRGWAGLKSQVLVVLGGVMIWFTYVMIHILPASQASLHVYN